jgi:enterochelin esterase-like enzyme
MKLIIFYFLFLSMLVQTELYPQMNSNKENDVFKVFLKDIQGADENNKKVLADKFIQQVKNEGYPVFENDSTVVLLFISDAESVSLIGDMTNWASSVPLEKIEGTNLFYFRGQYEPEARLEYLFELNKDEFPMTDTLNEYKSLNGLWEMSELGMPRYTRHPLFKNYERGRKGDFEGLKEYEIYSDILGYSHTLHIYFPPGYNSENNYPSVYFQDGKDYIEFAIVPHILTELIRQGRIEPVIAVFVTPPNLHQPKVPNRMTEYGMNDDYVKFFTTELVPFVDSISAAGKESPDRLVAGDSYGGLISLYIAFSYPEIFPKAYSQSGYVSFSNDKIIKLFDSASVKPVDLFVDIGTYEENVGAAFLPPEETNFIEGNRRFKEILEKKGYKHIYKEYFEGHTWGNWRRHLIDALLYFFSTNGQER